jgi:hypothetical protein
MITDLCTHCHSLHLNPTGHTATPLSTLESNTYHTTQDFAETTQPQNYAGHTGKEKEDWCYGCGLAEEEAGMCNQTM